MRWVALLSLNAASTSIAADVLRPIAGRPAYAWSLDAALESGCFDSIVVASDSAAIRDDARTRFGIRIDIVEAPSIGTDDSIMREFAARDPVDVLALVAASTPLTATDDFRSARARFEQDMLDSLLTGVALGRFVWSGDGRPLDHDPRHREPRDHAASAVAETAAFTFTRRDWLLGNGTRLGGRVGVHRLDQDGLLDIARPSDRSTIERLLRRRIAIPQDLRMLVVDVDGTLTDGGMYYDANGEALKKFQTRDAKGLLMLRDAGVRICIVTAENSAVVHARMRKLGLTDYFPGVSNKPAWLAEHGPRFGATPAQTAYVGDDLNDLQCLSMVGFSCCPADAVPDVREAVHYVCDAEGGDGAVREVADLIRTRSRIA